LQDQRIKQPTNINEPFFGKAHFLGYIMTLFDGSAGETYKILSICGTVRLRLSELGFNPGCKIKILNKQHTDMMVVNCRESQIALRKEEAQCIHICPVKD
jgi:Fe2+ transport system protein FeoA